MYYNSLDAYFTRNLEDVDQSPFVHVESTKVVRLRHSSQNGNGADLVDMTDPIESEDLLQSGITADKRSSKKKLVILFHPSIAHAIIDTIPILFSYVSAYPDREIVILRYEQAMSGLFKSNIVGVVINALRAAGASITLVDEGDAVIADNFDAMINYSGSFRHSINEMDALDDGIEKIFPTSPEVSGKVYLSRKKTRSRDAYVDEKLSKINTDDRVFNEEALEKVFKEMGFEIVYPEKYVDFNDQLQKMRDTKVVAGVSGAGLSNFAFTSRKTKGRTLVEILTPIVTQQPREDGLKLANSRFHSLYFELANLMQGSSYITIPATVERDGEKIAAFIRNSPMFDYLSRL